MTITVMDDNKGLGDKNMDFLLGLDMLKRHRACINLGKNSLDFSTGNISTPFLAEYQLDESKGGTKGFDPDAANKELDEAIEKSIREENERKKGASGDGNDKGGKGDGDKDEGTSPMDESK